MIERMPDVDVSTRAVCAATHVTSLTTTPDFTGRVRRNADLYTRDFFQWTQTTATLLRQGKWHGVDPESVAEELESLGKRDRRELASRLQVLVMHLLTWHDQPARRVEGHSWRSTIRMQRLQLRLLLRDHTGLRTGGGSQQSPQTPFTISLELCFRELFLRDAVVSTDLMAPVRTRSDSCRRVPEYSRGPHRRS